MSESFPVDFKYLGRRDEFSGLDVFPNPGVSEVSCVSHEMTSNCPVTGQPDFYTIEITYSPNEFCIESKSLKLYLQSFKDVAMFGEALAVRVTDDVFEAITPNSVRVSLIQNPRGGIEILSTAEKHTERELF